MSEDCEIPALPVYRVKMYIVFDEQRPRTGRAWFEEPQPDCFSIWLDAGYNYLSADNDTYSADFINI